MSMTEQHARHLVVIVGGAVAGAEAASQLTQKDVICIVLEQNDRPYGKIEDGLPRWHEKQRQQEMNKIDGKLAHPGVHFVPRTRLGRDLALKDLLRWRPSAVILANGAWRDRPLPLSGVDQFVGHGFYYQNALVYWFNHYLETSYHGPQVKPADGALVVGGGLASLDVVKILMLETVTRALAPRGHHVDLYEAEQRGVSKILAERGMTLTDLGLAGCTITYRRRAEDMPLAEPKENATPEQMEQTRATRRKLLRLFVEKYLFTFQDQSIPVAYLSEGNRLTGLSLAAATTENGRMRALAGTEREIQAPLVISSIGSIPEPIPGIPMGGETYRLEDDKTGELEGVPGVFAVGNAVTGKGNILVSAKHGRVVSQHMLEHYLQGTRTGYEEVFDDAAAEARAKVSAVAERLARQEALTGDHIDSILPSVRELQARAGYPGDYPAWIALTQPTKA
jgi:NADPH-dependent glutamate synthase beta subunit-like oxidoreductase